MAQRLLRWLHIVPVLRQCWVFIWLTPVNRRDIPRRCYILYLFTWEWYCYPARVCTLRSPSLYHRLFCKARRQSLLTLQVSRYCLLALLGRGQHCSDVEWGNRDHSPGLPAGYVYTYSSSRRDMGLNIIIPVSVRLSVRSCNCNLAASFKPKW